MQCVGELFNDGGRCNKKGIIKIVKDNKCDFFVEQVFVMNEFNWTGWSRWRLPIDFWRI